MILNQAIRRLAMLVGLPLAVGAIGCGNTAVQTPDASLGGADASADTCTHDNCVVPVDDLRGVCPPTLHAATARCSGVAVSRGACGAVTHVAIKTVDPIQDCYYRTSSGELVGGIVRSDAGFTKIAGTIPSDACLATTQVCPGPNADGASDVSPDASSDANQSADAVSDACTQDNCVVPLADLASVCAGTLPAEASHCPGATVTTGPCGALTHVVAQTIGPSDDCYYDTASGALVGGIGRSDSGFTKLAGTIPVETCPATTQVCANKP